ncbi:hypothetical protein TUM20985_14640 [Mycobacterium antarcticum]|uniref:hypothetical protein n=1 Tax=unclassified Mycolicibacterium TaxID=2636767 RepID=UPI00239FF81F|nr:MULTISPECIES: hypothetical protein [unclassified Mycolicibacterium]BDX30917.1 hypothetical protein TUM20985_14640 [Mycolicibacterium sp. TUM20985]GLP74280.1 hypothetical protein TUM20983_13900 [Mycolicibacterium sp. TUM20983]GLP80076.1 hypothetical protein TUM20984_14960 [Mycolicibacterium sp. TUM20984]
MKQFALPIIAGLTAAAFAFGSAANAAPTEPSPAADTVKSLAADGYHVIVTRTGAGELSACSVTSVRTGQTFSTVDSRGGSSPAVTVVSKTMRVDLAC